MNKIINSVKRYSILFLLIAGSYGYSLAQKFAIPIFPDTQVEDSGGGYLRLLSFDIDKGTISTKMYSLYYNITKQDYSKFDIKNVEFLKIDN